MSVHDWKMGTETQTCGMDLGWYIDGADIVLEHIGVDDLVYLNREQALNLVAGVCHLLNQMEKK